jgi:hypothetical protein
LRERPQTRTSFILRSRRSWGTKLRVSRRQVREGSASFYFSPCRSSFNSLPLFPSTSTPSLFLPHLKTAFTNGDISDVSLDDYLSAGKYVVLAFYPKDFTWEREREFLCRKRKNGKLSETHSFSLSLLLLLLLLLIST